MWHIDKKEGILPVSRCYSMKINQKIVGGIILVLALVAIGGYFVFVKKFTFGTQQSLYTTTHIPSIPQANPEILPSEKNVTKQPAYLIAAYSKNGKQYIDVDFVEWFHDEASINAQVEDGKCSTAKDCYAYPNGYARNNNPGIRVFEVSPSASITVAGSIASYVSQFRNSGQNISISFETFESAVSHLTSYYSYGPSFKQPKTFILIDVKDSLVTNITEPYQE